MALNSPKITHRNISAKYVRKAYIEQPQTRSIVGEHKWNYAFGYSV